MKFNQFSFGITLITGALLLAACVDTTGLSAESSRTAKGPDSATVNVTEYADLQCPACASAHTLISMPLLEKYSSRIRFEFKHFPLRSIHPYAFEAAQASECAADQGKFWEFLDLNYVHQADLNSSKLREWAGSLGLDEALFDRCVQSGIKGKTVLDDFSQGEKIGVNSTPTYFVNGQRSPNNSVEAIGPMIDAALQNVQSVPL